MRASFPMGIKCVAEVGRKLGAASDVEWIEISAFVDNLV
jgi:hypothetical protein